jgi:hypothetical protein
MSNLSELASNSVRNAALSTGYKVPEKSDEPELTLFIWVYAPSEETQVSKATWGSVLANFTKWIIDEPCRTEN